MSLLKELLRQTEKIDFLFPNNFEELMNSDYYDYDKFEWFLYYVFKLEGHDVKKIGKKGKGDGGADIIINAKQNDGSIRRIGIQAKYWKNRVGTEPINQLASAKSRHDLTNLWIITTSDLTSDAKRITEDMDIKILRGDDVARLIESVKERYKEDMEKHGESSIEFIKPEKKKTQNKKVIASSHVKDEIDEEDIKLMKTLRNELSKKYKLYPLYTVYNNEMMYKLIALKPRNIEELSKIKGFGVKKVETIGKDIVDFINENFNQIKKQGLMKDENLYNALLLERVKIAKYNHLEENDVYDDKTAKNISKMKPQNKETLKRVFGFKEENIDIFGDYLIRFISKFIEDQN
jgi:superfamily II DNA helicase RecQ